MSEHQKTVIIDLDGTLAEYDVWRGPEHIGKPVKDAGLATRLLWAEGWHIVVYTTRGDVERVKQWLEENGIWYHAINSTEHNPPGCSAKPIGDVYIDDRAVTFKGNWIQTYKRVNRFKPWPSRHDGDIGVPND